MMQRVKQTQEEKVAMYMKCSKMELAKMLIECNKHLERLTINFTEETKCNCMEHRWEVKEDGNRYCVGCKENKTNY